MDTPEALLEELRRSFPGPHEREPSNLRKDIEDELADHLALATERERARGLDDQSARAAAIERFGNPRTIARKLWFQAMKEHIMRDRLLVGVNLLLAIVVIFAAVMIWRISDQSRQSNAALVVALEKLAAARQAPAQAASELTMLSSLAIHCTKGTSSGPPVEGVSLRLIGKPFNVTDDTLDQKSDLEGKTVFGPIQPGSYMLTASTGDGEKTILTQLPKRIVLYGGRIVTENIIVPEIQTASATVSAEIPDEIKKLPFLVLFRVTPKYDHLDDTDWRQSGVSAALSSDGKLYSTTNLTIEPEDELQSIDLPVGDVVVDRFEFGIDPKRLPNNSTQYRVAAAREYSVPSHSDLGRFPIKPGASNHITLKFRPDVLAQVNLDVALVKSSLEPSSIDSELLDTLNSKSRPGSEWDKEESTAQDPPYPGRNIQRIIPISKDCMILKYMPDWAYGNVDNIGIANNDGGVRTLIDWPAIPPEDLNANNKYLLALYSRKTDFKFKDANAAKGTILANEIAAEWPENTSWKNQPTIEKQPVVRFDMTPGGGWKIFDVTPIIRARIQAKKQGNGIMLHYADETTSGSKNNWSGYAFVSREGGKDQKGDWSKFHPMLIITK